MEAREKLAIKAKGGGDQVVGEKWIDPGRSLEEELKGCIECGGVKGSEKQLGGWM